MEPKKVEYPLGMGRYDRPEIAQLKEKGYKINNPRESVDIFERKIAEFAGSKYAVAVDNLTDGIFLALTYYKKTKGITGLPYLELPCHTYCSVPMAAWHAGWQYGFIDIKWEGTYRLENTNVIDSATRFHPNMYIKDSSYVLSFQHKKRLPIGKGGMILTDSLEAYNWFKAAHFEGRNLEVNQWDDEYSMLGWNMYMTPDDAARGILIFDDLLEKNEWDDYGSWQSYPDLSKKQIFNRR